MTVRPEAALRVLQVITDLDRRGGQLFAVDLADELAAHGVHVTTAALWPGGAGQPIPGVRVLDLGRSALGFRRPLAAAMREADVVVAHGSHTLMATAVSSLGVATPVVYRQISDLLFWAGSLPRRLRVRWYLSRMSAVVALWDGSARVLGEHFGVAGSSISVVPNGVRVERFAPPDPARRSAARAKLGVPESVDVVLCVGALVPEKGVDLVVRAMADVAGVLLVAGDGPERPALEALAREACPGRAVFAGTVADVTEVYHAADVLVLASRGGDSMPAAVIEAALSGLPAVVTPVDAIPTMVADGATGAVVAPAPAAIATGIAAALAHRHDWGDNARQRCIDAYSMQTVGSQWLDVLRRCVETAPARDPAPA